MRLLYMDAYVCVIEVSEVCGLMMMMDDDDFWLGASSVGSSV